MGTALAGAVAGSDDGGTVTGAGPAGPGTAESAIRPRVPTGGHAEHDRILLPRMANGGRGRHNVRRPRHTIPCGTLRTSGKLSW